MGLSACPPSFTRRNSSLTLVSARAASAAPSCHSFACARNLPSKRERVLPSPGSNNMISVCCSPMRKTRLSSTQTTTARAEHRGREIALMLQRRPYLLARLGLPDPRRVVVRSRDHAPPVPAEHRGIDRLLMLQRTPNRLARLGLPDPRRAVLRSRDHAPSVRAELRGIDIALMLQKRPYLLARLGLPDPRRAVLRSRDHAPP